MLTLNAKVQTSTTFLPKVLEFLGKGKSTDDGRRIIDYKSVLACNRRGNVRQKRKWFDHCGGSTVYSHVPVRVYVHIQSDLLCEGTGTDPVFCGSGSERGCGIQLHTGKTGVLDAYKGLNTKSEEFSKQMDDIKSNLEVIENTAKSVTTDREPYRMWQMRKGGKKLHMIS